MRKSKIQNLTPKIFIALLLFTLGGCAPEADLEVPDDLPEMLYFETIGRGQNATLTDTTEIVLRDSAAWAEVQAHLHPLSPFKPVAFDQAMVLVIAIPDSTSGKIIEVESVEQHGSDILVSYLLSEPAKDCMPAMAVNIPFQVLLVRRAEGTVRFERRTEPYRCGMK